MTCSGLCYGNSLNEKDGTAYIAYKTTKHKHGIKFHTLSRGKRFTDNKMCRLVCP